MSYTKQPPALATPEAGNVDQAGKRVGSPYRSETSSKKVKIYSFFEAYGFLHSYGPDRPLGRGWFVPDIDAVEGHWVRPLRRRRRR
jgi:hypothetical protein